MNRGESYRFHVMGLPAPQGSKTRMPNGALVEGASTAGRAKLRSWRDAVVDQAARQVALAPAIDQPVKVQATFRLPMPRSRPKRLQQLGTAPCTVKPDLDKLVRSTLDCLVQSGMLRDDSLVAQLEVSKWEVVGWTGADIQVTVL